MSVWGTVPDWAAAIGTVGTFTAGLLLLRKQGHALTLQNRVLKKELERFYESEIREMRAQAETVAFHKIPGVPADDYRPFHSARLLGDVRSRWRPGLVFELSNKSGERIRDIGAAAGKTGVFCFVRDGDTEVGEGGVPVLPPGQAVRFYWWDHQGDLPENDVCVYFRDANWFLWGVHNEDGLFAPDDPDA